MDEYEDVLCRATVVPGLDAGDVDELIPRLYMDWLGEDVVARERDKFAVLVGVDTASIVAPVVDMLDVGCHARLHSVKDGLLTRRVEERGAASVRLDSGREVVDDEMLK